MLLITLWIIAIVFDWGPIRDYSIIVFETLISWVENLSQFGDWLVSELGSSRLDGSGS